MSEENAPVEDDATVVNDELAPEKAHEDLVADVAKLIGRDEYGDDTTVEATDNETPPEAEQAKDEEPALSKEILARAETAGLSKDLAENLHRNGQLEETLAAFDKVFVERFQSQQTEEPKKREEDPPEATTEEVPELDPDIYDEEIIKRDKFHKSRIDALEARLEEVLGDRQAEFDNWFDGELAELGYDVEDTEKCAKTFKAYQGLCEAQGIAPEKRDPEMVKRAHAAMYPNEAKKQEQKQALARERDAEGKFLPSSKPKGAPPAKELTPEESHSELVGNVARYLKKQGVDMYG